MSVSLIAQRHKLLEIRPVGYLGSVTTHRLNIMHSRHVRLPGIILLYLLSFHSMLTPVLCMILIYSPSVHNPMPNPFAQLLYTRYCTLNPTILIYKLYY